MRVSSTGRISVPAHAAYRLIADYRSGHPRIVPPGYFRDLIVEQGGYGAGTHIRFTMTVLGTTKEFTSVVSEPDPGRVLVEHNHDGGVTTFVVEPRGADACEVTIATDLPNTPGLAGAIERFVSKRLLPRIYREEIARIEQHARPTANG